MQRRGSFIFEDLTLWPPGLHCSNNKGFGLALKLPFASGSLGFMTWSASWDEASAWVKTNVLGIAGVMFLSSVFAIDL